MKLLGGDGSPYVRKVRLVCLEKGLPVEFRAASPSDPASGVAAANPLSKIPTLVLDDGRGLYDSSVIVEYLDGLNDTQKLIPANQAERIEVRRWEALGNGIADATVEIVHDRRRPADKQLGAEYEAKQMIKIRAGLAAMEKDLGANEFCFGGRFTLADIAFRMAAEYASRALPEFDWRAAHPALAKHFDRLSQRPAFKT